MELLEIYCGSDGQDWWDLSPAQRDEWCAYLRKHGADTKMVGFPLVVEKGGSDMHAKYVIRYKEYLLDENGRKYLTPDKQNAATRTRWLFVDATPPGL